MISIHASRARRALRGAALVALSTVALVACDDEVPPPFEVEGSGTISGLLFYDEGRDGVYEPVEGDSALAGIPVWLQVRGTDEAPQVVSGSETVTDAQGRFTITNAPIGTYDLVFDADELDDAGVVACQNPRPVSVRASEVSSVVAPTQISCLITIAEARELPDGEIVTVQGVVTVSTGNLSASYFFVQDATGGLKVFNSGTATAGQFVEITGTTLLFSGAEEEITDGTTTVLGTAPIPDPIVITGEQLVSHDFQGSLVEVEDLTVTQVDGTPAAGVSYNVRVTAPDGAAFIIRVDSDAAITPGIFVVGNTYDVTGVVSPFGGAEQLYVRSNADIAAAS